jgi:diketogulonate reductase-like aldo/keto reductase
VAQLRLGARGCAGGGVIVLGSGCPFSDPTVGAIAKDHGASAAQVCIRWLLQRGVVIAVGTGNNASTVASYSEENLGALTMPPLTDAEMARLGNLQL